MGPGKHLAFIDTICLCGCHLSCLPSNPAKSGGHERVKQRGGIPKRDSSEHERKRQEGGRGGERHKRGWEGEEGKTEGWEAAEDMWGVEGDKQAGNRRVCRRS